MWGCLYFRPWLIQISIYNISVWFLACFSHHHLRHQAPEPVSITSTVPRWHGDIVPEYTGDVSMHASSWTLLYSNIWANDYTQCNEWMDGYSPVGTIVVALIPEALRLNRFSEWTMNIYCWQDPPTDIGVSIINDALVLSSVAEPDSSSTDVMTKLTSSPSREKPGSQVRLTPKPPPTGNIKVSMVGGDGSPIRLQHPNKHDLVWGSHTISNCGCHGK